MNPRLTEEQDRAIKAIGAALQERLITLFKGNQIDYLIFTTIAQKAMHEFIDDLSTVVGPDRVPELFRAYADSLDLMNSIPSSTKSQSKEGN